MPDEHPLGTPTGNHRFVRRWYWPWGRKVMQMEVSRFEPVEVVDGVYAMAPVKRWVRATPEYQAWI